MEKEADEFRQQARPLLHTNHNTKELLPKTFAPNKCRKCCGTAAPRGGENREISMTIIMIMRGRGRGLWGLSLDENVIK